MKFYSEHDIEIPPARTIALFRRLLDGLLYYKDSSGIIHKIHSEEGIYSIVDKKNILSFSSFTNYVDADEKIKLVKRTAQEFIFYFEKESQKVIYKKSGGYRGGEAEYQGGYGNVAQLTPLIYDNRDFGVHPIVLGANEGLLLRNITAWGAAGVAQLFVNMEWMETPVY